MSKCEEELAEVKASNVQMLQMLRDLNAKLEKLVERIEKDKQ